MPSASNGAVPRPPRSSPSSTIVTRSLPIRSPSRSISHELPTATLAALNAAKTSLSTSAATSRSKITGTRMVGGLRAPSMASARWTACSATAGAGSSVAQPRAAVP